MNYEFFISRHIAGKYSGTLTGTIVKIAITSIAISLAIMIISVAIVTGYQIEIRNKVIGFGSHIQIVHYDSNNSYESVPIEKDQSFLPELYKINGIRHVQSFALKAGIIKTENQIEGIVLKGVDKDYDWSFFGDKIIAGKGITINDTATSNEIIISKIIADRLNLKVGDPLRMYFISGGETVPRGRKFTVSGIYETGLEELDKLYAICDINHIRKLNNWTEEQISGFEIIVNDFDEIENIKNQIYDIISYDLDARTIKDEYPDIFDWLGLFDTNVTIILILMILVSSINMISALLILILENTNMIGVLKTLGAKNSSIRKIFIYNGFYIIVKGLIFGNIIALTLCFIQIHTGLITLDQESYYMSVVPINLNILHILIINIGTIIICTLMLLLPTRIIARITPLKAIRFD